MNNSSDASSKISLNKLDLNESTKIAENTIETVEKQANDSGNVTLDASNEQAVTPETQPPPPSDTAPNETTETPTDSKTLEPLNSAESVSLPVEAQSETTDPAQSQDPVKPEDSVQMVDSIAEPTQKKTKYDPNLYVNRGEHSVVGGSLSDTTSEHQYTRSIGIYGYSKPKIGYY
jgi:hypothetical protein